MGALDERNNKIFKAVRVLLLMFGLLLDFLFLSRSLFVGFFVIICLDFFLLTGTLCSSAHFCGYYLSMYYFLCTP